MLKGLRASGLIEATKAHASSLAHMGAGASVDSWDKMRERAIACLLRLPTPLPGLGTPDALLPQLQWAARLLRSPRVRDSDAGKPCFPCVVLHF